MALFLDTETTGFSPDYGAEIIEVAIIDERGRPVVNSLVKPEGHIPWKTTEITGIDASMVASAPTFKQVWPIVREAIAGRELVIFNAKFDREFFPKRLSQATAIHCAMSRFQAYHGGRAKGLPYAAKYVRHRWNGNPHRALSDALACRSVWMWLNKR